MTDLENNLKINFFMCDKCIVDDFKVQINQKYIEIDDLIYNLENPNSVTFKF